MGEVTLTEYAQAATTAITCSTDAADTYDLSAGIDNSATGNLNLYADIEFVTSTINLSSQVSPSIYIWICTRFDGTNYSDPQSAGAVGRPPDAIIPLTAASQAHREVARLIPIPPEYFKILYQNKSGVTLGTATIKYRTYGETVA